MINRQFRQQDGTGEAAAQDESKPQKTVVEMLAKPGTMRQGLRRDSTAASTLPLDDSCKEKGIFDGLVIYVNGSTFPLISDHKLKHLLCENGANMSLHLGRRRVTHVILGRATASSDTTMPLTRATSSSAAAAGDNTQRAASLVGSAGGGLAGGKMEKEIRRVGGCGIKYVGVEW